MAEQRFDLPPELERYVRRFAVRRRRLALVRRLGLTLSLAILFALAACLADRVLKLSGEVRALLLAGTAAILVVPLVRPIVGLFRRMDYLAAAVEIERRAPRFGQRLLTLVSQHALPAGRRGSAEFLGRVREDVNVSVAGARVTKLLPWSRAAGPWFLACLAGAVAAVGWNEAPWLDLPRLAVRLAVPLGDVPPVTTTRVLVSPGAAARVVEGETLTIEATVDPADSGDAVVRVGGAGGSVVPMNRVGAASGVYSLTVPAVEQSFVYSVAAGDAVSPQYAVTVLRHPAVADLRVRYTYPEYARREPLTAACRDGLVEAPAGTRATLQVVATEPLRSGALVSPGGRVELRHTADPRTLEADVAMTADQGYQVELVSADGVAAKVATRVLVRPVADRPPLVRMLQPVDDLRLDPHAVLPIWYEAVDDIGVTSLTAHVKVNGGPVKDVPIPVAGDGRQLASSYDLDLAPLELSVGDLLAVSLTATDGLKQSAVSEERHVLITPRSIDIATYQRVADLKQAAHVAGSLEASLEAAAKAAGAGRVSALGQQLAGAAESEAVLRQALSRAVTRAGSPALATTLANMLDAAAACTASTARAAGRVSARDEVDAGVREAVDGALAAGRGLKAQLAVVSAGQQAAATLADRVNLRAAATRPATQSTAAHVARTLDRARADVTAAAVALGMDPNAPDLDARLQHLVDASEALVRSQRPVDYVPAAAEWARQLGGAEAGGAAAGGFADRLDAAASVEASRADADQVWVGDLRLIAKAVRATEEAFAPSDDRTTAATRPVAVEAREQIPGAVRALQAVHVGRSGAATRAVAEVQRVHEAASEARGKLRRYAGEADILLSAADALTRQVAGGTTEQEGPAAGPGGEGTRSGEGEAAGRPGGQTVAPTAEGRESAAAAIREVQESLVAMPGELSRLLQAADASRAASARAEDVRRGMATAPADRRPVARRIADQAESAREGARASVAEAARALSPGAAEELSARLQRTSPEAAGAANSIDTRLAPALRSLQQALGSGDAGALDAAAGATREAIGLVQADLRRAQADLAAKDPVAAARWFGNVGVATGLERLTGADAGRVPYTTGLGMPRVMPVRGPDPPGYEEALRAYFDALAKEAGGTDGTGKSH